MDGSESTELNVDEKDKIFIIQENPYFVAIVYPQKNRLDAKGASARPGVVVKTARMTKKRCRTRPPERKRKQSLKSMIELRFD